MSLRPDERQSRARSKSGTRDRSRSRSNIRQPEPPSPPSAPKYAYTPQPLPSGNSGVPGAYGSNEYGPRGGVASPTYHPRAPPPADYERSNSSDYYDRNSSSQHPYPPPREELGGFTMGDYTDLPPHERPGYVPPAQHVQSPREEDRHLAYGDVTSPTNSRQQPYGSSSYFQSHQSPPPPDQYQRPSPDSYRSGYQDSGYNYPQDRPHPDARSNSYHYERHYSDSRSDSYHQDRPHPDSRSNSYYQERPHPDSRSDSYTYQYAQPPDKITYTTKPQDRGNGHYADPTQSHYQQQAQRTYSYDRDDDRSRDDRTRPSGRDRTYSNSKTHRLSLDTRSGGHNAPPSPGLTARTSHLSVGGSSGNASHGAGGLPPPSPLLEAYHGTYQQISPMPLAIRNGEEEDDDDLSDLEPLSPAMSRSSNTASKTHDKLSRESSERKKRVQIYDPEKHAHVIASALRHTKVDAEALSDVLPGLTHDEIMYLRKEYKKQVKIQGKGVNLPKHIKTKLTGNLGKVVYVVALGRWEGEGYWANFWYQSHSSRRELLIESLMGRTNGEIRNIEEEFKDKRYSDSLVKCMEKELKMDKFRVAVLMVLEQKRQEEQDVYPPAYIARDVEMLHRALTAKQGGESTMLEVIVKRSDAHLREVLRLYERQHGENFPRAALKKSGNLVGEVIAHILNGVINKPARDALLLHHALDDIAARNKAEELRYELLISRLVRVHWDRPHLLRVKKEYATKYGKRLEEEIEEATGSKNEDFGEFCVQLCKGAGGRREE